MAYRHSVVTAVAVVGVAVALGVGFGFSHFSSAPGTLHTTGACHISGICTAVDGTVEKPAAKPAPVYAGALIPADDVPTSTVSLLFLGDMMFDRNVAARIAASKDPAYTFQHLHPTDAGIFSAQDVIVGNLEGPVNRIRKPETKSIDFSFSPNIPALLKSVGIDALSQANNHSLDQGRDGAVESRELVSAAGLAVFGDETREDATSSIVIIERHGKKIALVGFNTTEAPLNEIVAGTTIQQAKQQADEVVVFMHWGHEYQAKPTDEQVSEAHWMIDQGVDAIIGGHPHWMESVEVYNKHIIAYSLGNCIFDQDFSSETRFGLIVGLVLDGSGSELHLYPISIHLSQPEVLTSDARDARLKYLASISDPSLTSQILDGVLKISK